MCVVSMIMDHYGDKWGQRLPQGPRPYEWPMIAKQLGVEIAFL